MDSQCDVGQTPHPTYSSYVHPVLLLTSGTHDSLFVFLLHPYLATSHVASAAEQHCATNRSQIRILLLVTSCVMCMDTGSYQTFVLNHCRT